jgi:hypothetical protein
VGTFTLTQIFAVCVGAGAALQSTNFATRNIGWPACLLITLNFSMWSMECAHLA